MPADESGTEVAKNFLNDKIIKDAFEYRKHIEFKYNFKMKILELPRILTAGWEKCPPPTRQASKKRAKLSSSE